MEYLDLFKNIGEANVRYLICGGLAVNIYGIPRMTADIDLLLDFEQENILSFEKIMSLFNYKPILPIQLNSLTNAAKRNELKKEKNLIAFSYFNSVENMMSVDVLIDSPLSFEEMWNAREERKVDNVAVNITSVEHLIEMKKYSNRTQDKQDVVFLTRFKNEN